MPALPSCTARTNRKPARPRAEERGQTPPARAAGIDSHKDTLTACVVDRTGHQIDIRTFVNTGPGHAQAAGWLAQHRAARVGIEGAGSYRRALAVALVNNGTQVVEVPPQMTARDRRRQRTRQKTDEVDALLIARIALREDRLPPPRPQGQAEQLRALVAYRRELVAARTADINRLHADLTVLRPGYQNKLNTSGLASNKALERMRRLLTGEGGVQTEIARDRIRRIKSLNRGVARLNAQIRQAVQAAGATLTSIHGIGNLLTAEILAEVGDVRRFQTKHQFAMANGTAPLQASSGRTVRHRLNRGGNRQLNRALHYAAITQIARPGTEGRRYYERRLNQGKNRQEAIRCLKRHISNRVYKHLQQTPVLT